MGAALYGHNQKAYDSALALMEETGKAAVIHPTGTGKSFIGFKLAEQHPDKRICWLSPSEYIFKTQLENLIRAGGDKPENIDFITYAKLMISDGAFIKELNPDFIILDEFHRCGASEWGKGAQRLLNEYPKAKILGLSATNIRYLDNRRDMADELFGGNIASDMTLGDAVVQNILPAPTYVISVYAYQRELEKYSRRIERIKRTALRQKGRDKLEALRRTLEKADGLDVVFQKHISDKSGKFIVFCSNVEHMREMADKAPEWFALVDKQPHIYTAYSDNPAANKEFAEFKQDDSEHLKLLYCIDMLNEGIHVEDVSGVILSRPTVSPIVFKQQIGRALAAGSKKAPVIFDIVNNFENLCSIGAIQEEMIQAAGSYRYWGEEDKIINESFKIIDLTLDCGELFEQIQESLSSSWDGMYEKAAQFYHAHGHLDVPKRYVTEDRHTLGSWIGVQRRVRAGAAAGILTDSRVRRLDEIGMIWDNRLEQRFER